jgi:trans-2,3-dihydro-3-hydroxyanthranilate isomerase
MTGRRYLLLDVFANRALQGNPLAVVLDAEGLDTARMQAITREFNLSETVFVLPPENPAHAARIRIFCPEYEMPFAGHPTVGTAVALAGERGHADGALLVLEENIGPVRCIVQRGEGASYAEFDVPRIAEAIRFSPDRERLAAALGLAPDEIGFPGHAIGAWSAGVPYVTVPVRDLAAMARIRFDTHLWQDFAPAKASDAVASAYAYCRQTMLPGSTFHARMFVAATPSYEDPATGSAAAAFVGAFVANQRPHDGSQEVWIEQGIEMGRPSRIRLEIDVASGVAVKARIGGDAVVVGRGEIYV